MRRLHTALVCALLLSATTAGAQSRSFWVSTSSSGGGSGVTTVDSAPTGSNANGLVITGTGVHCTVADANNPGCASAAQAAIIASVDTVDIWDFGIQGNGGADRTNGAAGRIYFQYLRVRKAGQAMGAVHWLPPAVSATANAVIMALYGPLVTPNTCVGAPLVAQTTSANQSSIIGTGVTAYPVYFDFSSQPAIQDGDYCLALQGANTSIHFAGGTQVYGPVITMTSYYDGVAGTMPNPAPAMTVASNPNNTPAMALKKQ